MPAPLHRIEYWNGSYFRPASLWEVGTYILVQHHKQEDLCNSLQYQKKFLESQQLREDDEEQKQLQAAAPDAAPDAAPNTAPNTASDTAPNTTAPDTASNTTAPDTAPNTTAPDTALNTAPDTATLYDDIDMTWNDEANADAIFEADLNNWLNNPTTDNILDDNIESNEADTDIHNMVEYLGPSMEASNTAPNLISDPPSLASPGSHSDPGTGPTSEPPAVPGAGPGPGPGAGAGPDFRIPRPTADGLNNAYVRVLHTNGIHHIGMVTCSCGGRDNIPLDLFASRLLPASFIKIRTIFSAQLMDYFRLCNLELKASAYQFYQLIQRLTLPLGQSEMINLYHEFRRMSRLWRWMKKLKWAGYGHNQQDHSNPPAGSLSIFCPTCPQPNTNLPEDWKLDKNR
jgi:hypothetical protein